MPRKKPPHHTYFGLLPNSTAAWRWDRAYQIFRQGKKRSLNRDGPDIYRAVGFLRRTLDDFTGYGVRQLLKEDPSLTLAVKMRTASWRRELEIQCRALAGESAGVIAVEVGSTKNIIETYCKFFFDVADRLDQFSYIRHRVIRVPVNGPASLDSLAKLSCFNNGPAVVPAWMDYLVNVGQLHDLRTDWGRQREAIELFVDAMNLKLTPDTESSFVKRAAFIHEVGDKMFHERNTAELIRLNVQRMLTDSVSWAAETTGADGSEVDRSDSTTEKRGTSVAVGKMEKLLRAI